MMNVFTHIIYTYIIYRPYIFLHGYEIYRIYVFSVRMRVHIRVCAHIVHSYNAIL